MNGNGPLSPEEIERARLYYGGEGISSSAAEPPPIGPPAPPPPTPDAPPMYDYWGGARDLSAPAPTGPTPADAFNAPAPALGGIVGRSPPPMPVSVATPAGPATDANIPPPPPARTEEGGRTPTTTLGTEPLKGPSRTAPAPKATAYYGGAPAGPSAIDKATKGLRGTYDLDKEATQRAAEAEKARADVLAVGQAAIAQQKIDDQAIAQMEAANATRTFNDYSFETQRQIDDVRAKRLNPNERYADTGSAALAVIGGALGGLYQGLNHLDKNPFIEQMNKTFDQDLAVQERNLATQKEGIGERKSLLAEMRATYKDDALAKLQARNLYYEGAKEALAAQAANYESPTIQARADQAISALSREQSKLDIQEAIRKAAAAQAAAAAAEHRRQVDFDNRLKLDKAQREWAELGVKAEHEGGKQGADLAARFVGTGKDADGNPIGYIERSIEAAKERANATSAAQKLIKQIDRVQEIRNRQGWTGRVASEAVHGLYDTTAANELAVLESDMTTNAAQAAHLGALSESDRGLMRVKFRDLNSPGAGADERLNEIRRIAQSGLDAETEAASGARATKIVGPDGREHVVMSGSSNALNNRRAVPREPVR